MNKIFISDGTFAAYVWILTPEEFIAGAHENDNHLEHSPGPWEYNRLCNCWQCHGSDFDSELDWALYREHAKQFDTFEEAYASKSLSIEARTALDEIQKLPGGVSYRVSKETKKVGI